MEIANAHGAYNQISQVNELSQIDRVQDVASQEPDNKIEMPQDKVTLSENSRDLQLAREAAESAPDIRAEKVAEIKQAVMEGRYEINPEKIADEILRSGL